MVADPSYPSCSQCGEQMLLIRIVPDRPSYEQKRVSVVSAGEVDGALFGKPTRCSAEAKQHFENWGKQAPAR